MIIDSHCHAWPRWPYQPPVPDDASRGAVEQLLWEMDRNGVDRAAIVCARIERNPDNNDYVAAAVARFPTRLHQFADADCRWSPDYHTAGAAGRSRGLPTTSSPTTIRRWIAGGRGAAAPKFPTRQSTLLIRNN